MAMGAILLLGARDGPLGLVLHDWQSDPVRSTWTEVQQLAAVGIIVVLAILAGILVALFAKKEVQEDDRASEEATGSWEGGREQ